MLICREISASLPLGHDDGLQAICGRNGCAIGRGAATSATAGCDATRKGAEMRRAVLVLMLAIAPCMGLADELRGRVVGVADGDTLTVLDAWRQQIKVRLAEIDAPEKAQPYGQRSKQALSGLCYGREAIIDNKGRDRYGRTIGRVRCGGVDVNAEQMST